MALLPSLSISIVVYQSNSELCEQTVRGLVRAVLLAKSCQRVASVDLTIVDNGGLSHDTVVRALLTRKGQLSAFDSTTVLSGHGNIGYGCGHNLAWHSHCVDYHIVLNPDVLLDENALVEATDFMQHHRSAGLLAPAVVSNRGVRQYLCRRYPTVFDLLLRGFAPSFLQRYFAARLERYEMRDLVGEQVVWDVPLASGCFMFFRHSALLKVNGFAPEFFLYFEDYDLSLRISKVARVVYVPSVRITHYGGGAARKGWRHIRLFIGSAIRFFHRHGWVLI